MLWLALMQLQILIFEGHNNRLCCTIEKWTVTAGQDVRLSSKR